MNVVGIDMGSSFIKGILMTEDGREYSCMKRSGHDYSKTAREIYDELLDSAQIKDAKVCSTGCGDRCLPFPAEHANEMKCLIKAAFVHVQVPCVILDLGGQASRLCVMDANGRLESFDCSAKCASGSGRVLENVANVLGLPFDELAIVAGKAQKPAIFTTGCAVFAESEAITAVAKGESNANIIAGFYQAICMKIISMLDKAPQHYTVLAAGGMAKDSELVSTLEKLSHRKVSVLPDPQLCIARGAALQSISALAE